ncbi:MAG: HAD-IC family P-type ATPase [SAR324 cluster bacterium]|nr:HAD-IC family P-type ATPase [SAR324 cluster bacterium]
MVHEASETSAAKIGRILQNTADFKSSVEARTIQFADMLAGPTIAMGGVTWAMMGPISATAMVSCNFMETTRMTVPLGVLNYLRLASEQGILVKDGRCLELLKDVDTVVFDKTGTLTLEEPQVGQIYLLNDEPEEVILQYAAAAEHKQSHPIAKAIVKQAKACQIMIPEIEDALYEIGYGIKVKVGTAQIHVGSERFMTNEAISLSPGALVQKIRQTAEDNGYGLVYVACNQQLIGILELHVSLRPEAQSVIGRLKELGLATYIISGDHEAPTRKLAQELGIEHYFSEVLPQDKAKIIQELQLQGKSICFIGDGINDTVALKTANVSVSIQGASTAALDTAGIVLMDHTLKHVPTLFELATEMADNTRHGFLTAIIPGAIGITGIFLFNFKILASLILFITSVGAGSVNAMLPLMKNRQKSSELLMEEDSHSA